MTEMRDRQNKKLRGDLFEEFCKRYLEFVYKTEFSHVWLFSDIPPNERETLGIGTRDEGIDIVAKDTDNRYYAVQVKYRKHIPHKRLQCIGWKQLSTFYALVYRSGPFYKHIVMTNVNGVRHVSKKTKQDVSICKKRFQNMTFWDWKALVVNKKSVVSRLTNEEVRLKRLAYLSKQALC